MSDFSPAPWWIVLIARIFGEQVIGSETHYGIEHIVYGYKFRNVLYITKEENVDHNCRKTP